jgi:hypothetical protein
MLTRRGFAGCAICALTGVIATDASAQAAAPVATTGYTRKILSQMDGPTPGYVTILVEAELQAGGHDRATHASGNRIHLYLRRQRGDSHPRSTDPFI